MIYPLRAFTNGRDIIITRGEVDVLTRVARHQPRGVTISELNFVPIGADKIYSLSHPFDWLHKAPICEGGESKWKKS